METWDTEVLELDDTVGEAGVVEAPHSNALLVDGAAIVGGREHHLQDVLILEEVLEAALEQKLLVPAGPEEVDLTGTGFDLDQAQHWKLVALKWKSFNYNN